MKYGVDNIIRVYAVRVLFWKNGTPIEGIYPYSFVVGKNNDGTCYFRNPYTELPNELNRRTSKYVNDLFQHTIKTIDEIVNHPKQGLHPHADEIWNFHVWYQNGEEETIKCKNLDIRLSFVEDNDVILSGEICGGNLFCKSLVTLDEVRNEITYGYVPFDRFYHFIKEEYTASDDMSFVRYEKKQDGGVILYAGNYYGGHVGDPYVIIDREGNIEQAGSMYYVQLLKSKGIRIILDGELL